LGPTLLRLYFFSIDFLLLCAFKTKKDIAALVVHMAGVRAYNMDMTRRDVGLLICCWTCMDWHIMISLLAWMDGWMIRNVCMNEGRMDMVMLMLMLILMRGATERSFTSFAMRGYGFCVLVYSI